MDAKHDKHMHKNKEGESHLHLPRPTNAVCALPATETGHDRLSFHLLKDLARNAEELKNTPDSIIQEIIKPVGEFENYLDL